jgi:hypothetical protein
MHMQKERDPSPSLEDAREHHPAGPTVPEKTKKKKRLRLSLTGLGEFENLVVKLACVAMTCITLLGIVTAAAVWLIKEIVWLIYGPTS